LICSLVLAPFAFPELPMGKSVFQRCINSILSF
jgi:hypothetical protein